MFSTIADKPSAKAFKAVQVLATVNTPTDFERQKRRDQIQDLAKTMDSDTLDEAINLLENVRQLQRRVGTSSQQQLGTGLFS